MNNLLDQLKSGFEDLNAPRLIYCKVCQEPYMSDPLSNPISEGYCTKTCLLMHFELTGVETGKIAPESYNSVQKEDMARKVQQRVSIIKYYNNLLVDLGLESFILTKKNLCAIKENFEPLIEKNPKVKTLINLTNYLITTREWYINEETI